MAWALEQSKFFTMGCNKLTVATDHKPLVSLLGQKSLDQVSNARLFYIKPRISMWKLRHIHCPGRTNFFADVTSRNPVSPEDDTDNERHFVAVNLASVADDRGSGGRRKGRLAISPDSRCAGTASIWTLFKAPRLPVSH